MEEGLDCVATVSAFRTAFSISGFAWNSAGECRTSRVLLFKAVQCIS